MRQFRISPMFGVFAAFEFKYQIRSTLFFVTTALFFAFTFAFVTVPQMSKTLAGVAHINSPHAISMLIASMATYAIFIPVVFLSSVVMRDHQLGTDGLFFTRPVTEFDYLAGRFVGAFAVCCLVLLAAPLAILAGSFAPWVEPATLGQLRPFDYIYDYLLFGAANLLIPGALLFTVANLTRSSLATYTATIVFLVFYFTGSSLGAVDEYRRIVALFDPYGLFAYREITRYWAPHELNTQLVPLQGLLLWNRVLWLGICAAALAYNAAVFSFRAAAQRRPRRRVPEHQAGVAVAAGASRATLIFGPATLASQFLLRVRYEAGGMFRSFSFWTAVLIGFGLIALAPLLLIQLNGTPVYPVTRMIINVTTQFNIVPMFVLIYFGAELMWRDRGYRMQDVLDVTPTPSWLFVASKLCAMWLVLFALCGLFTLAAIAMQIILGGSWAQVDLSLFLQRTFFFNFYNVFLLSILSVFFQVVTGNRYAGMLLMIVFVLSRAALNYLGYQHDLYRFGDTPAAPYSDMNGNGHFLIAKDWFRLYWTWFAALLAVLTFALWNRGTLMSLRARLRALPARLGRTGAMACAVLLLGFAVTGGYIFYNTNVLGTYRSTQDMERLSLDYEKAYRQYQYLPQPRITGVQLAVDIYPRERRYEARGTYVIENKTGAPIPRVHVGYGLGTLVRRQALEGAHIVQSDPRQLYYIWQFDSPLQPGEHRTLSFTVARENPGFGASADPRAATGRVVWNGTFFSNFESMPALGFNPRRMIQDRSIRRRYGLQPVDRLPPLEDRAAAARSYISTDADWLSFDATVSTSADQIAIAPGDLQREWEEGGRRYFHYRMATPILNFYSFLSARYQVTQAVADGVRLQVFHDPAHAYNVRRMIEAMQDAIAYDTAAFSPFQHRQMRIFEFPQFFGAFAQSFPNSVPTSEDAGFINDNRDPARIDNVYYITAHEVAHQWWAHQLMGGNMQGATMLSETFAQYSALMLMKHKYGENHVQRFLRYELDNYLVGRGSEAVGEVPLYRVENQPYIHYSKGSLVMYALQDYIGEDVVNRALARFLREYAYKYAPYPRSTDFLRILRAEAGPKYDALITDLFQKIVLFDLKAAGLSVTRRGDGRFDVALTVEARKFEADGQGEEKEVPLDYAIDIGLFAKHPEEVVKGDAHVLLLERCTVKAGKNVFRFVLDKAPQFGGIDPYNKLIDRVPGDNIISSKGEYRQKFQVPAPEPKRS